MDLTELPRFQERRFFAMQNDVPPDESSPLSSGVISSGKAGLLTSELM
jgi:hypothetical protein